MQGVLTKVHINACKYRGERNRVVGHKDLKTRKKRKKRSGRIRWISIDGFSGRGLGRKAGQSGTAVFGTLEGDSNTLDSLPYSA